MLFVDGLGGIYALMFAPAVSHFHLFIDEFRGVSFVNDLISRAEEDFEAALTVL